MSNLITSFQDRIHAKFGFRDINHFLNISRMAKSANISMDLAAQCYNRLLKTREEIYTYEEPTELNYNRCLEMLIKKFENQADEPDAIAKYIDNPVESRTIPEPKIRQKNSGLQICILCKNRSATLTDGIYHCSSCFGLYME